jgi:hypothetical protein
MGIIFLWVQIRVQPQKNPCIAFIFIARESLGGNQARCVLYYQSVAVIFHEANTRRVHILGDERRQSADSSEIAASWMTWPDRPPHVRGVFNTVRPCDLLFLASPLS